MRLAVWGPLPPSHSGIADYSAEQLPGLARHFDVTAVVEDPSAVAGIRGVRMVAAGEDTGADIDLYQLGNSPAHGYVYGAALRRPGVVLLHDWNLHHLVLHETVERGDRAKYLRSMRRAHRDAGSFLGSQIAAGLGGRTLPALFPLNERVLETAMAVVGLNGFVARQAARHLAGRPVLHLPHHVCLPRPVPGRAQARRELGLDPDALLVTAPGLATHAKRLDVALDVLARLRARYSTLRLVVAGGVEPGLPLEAWIRARNVGAHVLVTQRLSLEDFVRHLAAADVVLALRFPSHGEMSGALVRAMGIGRAVVVSAGSVVAEEFDEGLVAPVDPGVGEVASLEAVLNLLLGAPHVRDAMGRLAREHMRRHHGLDDTVARLAGFVDDVARERARWSAALAQQTAPEGSLEADMVDEIRWCARDLGLSGYGLDVEQRLVELCRPPRG